MGAWLDCWWFRASLAMFGIALLTYPQWLPKALAALRLLGAYTSKPTFIKAVDWQEAEDRLDAIGGEIDAIWNEYDDGQVEWTFDPVGSDSDGRRLKRFIVEAQLLGRKLKGCDIPRRFPNATLDDPAHEWLNVVSARVEPSSTHGDGCFDNRYYTWGCIEKVIDASKLTCRHFAAEDE